MQANEPFELGLIRTILGLKPNADLPGAVRRIQQENARLRDQLDRAQEEIQLALDDQRRTRKMLDGLLTEMELRGEME